MGLFHVSFVQRMLSWMPTEVVILMKHKFWAILRDLHLFRLMGQEGLFPDHVDKKKGLTADEAELAAYRRLADKYIDSVKEK